MDDDTKKTKRAGSIPRMALTPEELAESTGVGRTTIFEAIRNSELTARKAGNRTTLIECE
jgi:excisionase family DNA binding protein